MEHQRPAIECIRRRCADVLVTLPTGAGKSVLFQAPALYRGLHSRRLTLVISPLRALMRDQVAQLEERGFRNSVGYLSADLPSNEIEDLLQGVIEQRILVLYVAPERFRSPRFFETLQRRWQADKGFEYLVVDEAHCISQWGYEFRPDYFYALQRITALRRGQAQNKTPILFLSATVTAAVRNVLRQESEVPNYLPFEAAAERLRHPLREHIAIHPESSAGVFHGDALEQWHIEARLQAITGAARKMVHHRRQAGLKKSALLVFVRRRIEAEELAAELGQRLRDIAVAVDYFHAGRDADDRQAVYNRYKSGEIGLLVATKAFGMGMDIPHIHWVVHLTPPTALEDYLQEVGRIGRGEEERQALHRSTGVERLSALLLHASADFEINQANIKRGRLDFPAIGSLWQALVRDSREAEEGCRLALLPERGFDGRDDATRIKKMLFWLEKMERVEIVGFLPFALELRLFP